MDGVAKARPLDVDEPLWREWADGEEHASPEPEPAPGPEYCPSCGSDSTHRDGAVLVCRTCDTCVEVQS